MIYYSISVLILADIINLNGLAEAFILRKPFIENNPLALILGE